MSNHLYRMHSKFIGVVLAKKNSQRLKNKNLKKINNIHLVDYPILALNKSKMINKFILSSDSQKILKRGKRYKKCLLNLRPQKYCNSRSTSIKSLVYIIKKYKLNYDDYLVLLEPTSPMTNCFDINNVIKIIKQKKVMSLVSVGKSDTSNPYYSFPLNKKSFPLNKRIFPIRQNTSSYYFLDGSIYVSRIDELIKNKTFLTTRTLCYLFPKYKNFEIDDIEDFKIVKKLMQR